MRRIELVGGPQDGDSFLELQDMPKYLWFDGTPGHVTIYKATYRPRPMYCQETPTLYRFVGWTKTDDMDNKDCRGA